MTAVADGGKTMEALAAAARRDYRTVEDMVFAVVREAIVSGVYEPGQRLPQDRIAESIGVSRIPVRAALRRLEAEGFVVFEAHKGATVRSLSTSEIEEIYELRALLETFAIRSVASVITPDQIQELSDLADRVDDAEDGEAWATARRAFYTRLYEIADRPHTADLIARLREDVGRYWKLEQVSEGRSRGHGVIMQALLEGRTQDAAEWLSTHMDDLAHKLITRIG